MLSLKTKALCLALGLFLTGTTPLAGSRVSETAVLPLEDVARLSKKVENYAAERGARVFFIARQGRPDNELPDGVSYTHVSFAVYSEIQTEDGRKVPGYAIYNLYQDRDNPARSSLVVDFPLDFMAGAHRAKVGVIIPTRALQQRLYQVIHSEVYQKLHNPAYSAISNPYSDRYQNCTEHVLDVVNAAIYNTDNVEQLKVNSKKYFKAHKIRINPLKLTFASIFKPEIKTSDHHGGIRTATYGTISEYLREFGLAEEIADIYL